MYSNQSHLSRRLQPCWLPNTGRGDYYASLLSKLGWPLLSTRCRQQRSILQKDPLGGFMHPTYPLYFLPPSQPSSPSLHPPTYSSYPHHCLFSYLTSICSYLSASTVQLILISALSLSWSPCLICNVRLSGSIKEPRIYVAKIRHASVVSLPWSHADVHHLQYTTSFVKIMCPWACTSIPCVTFTLH